MTDSFEYIEKMQSLIERAVKTNHDEILHLAEMMADNMMNDHLIYAFGTGHSSMIATEMFSRAGGLANVVPMFDPDTLTIHGSLRAGEMERLSGVSDVIFNCYRPQKGDMIIINSTSGRNAMPIEMALRCKAEGVKVVALTSLEMSKANSSRHQSGKRLFELADLVLDTCCPDGDVVLNVEGSPVGPCSSIVTFMLVDAAICEAVRIMREKGFKPYLFSSQNKDSGAQENMRSYLQYYKRIPTL